MKLVFFGSDEFSLIVLKNLIKHIKNDLVIVTVPDSRQGRGKKITPSPVKNFAIEKGLLFFTPFNPNSVEFIEELKKTKPDYFILASYRFILKKELLSIVKYPLNIHPSLLPKYRGSAPIQRAIMNGDKETGVTIFIMDEKIDNGRIVLQKTVEINEEETYGELRDKLAFIGTSLLLEGIKLLEDNKIVPELQKGEISYAKKIKKEERFIKWGKPAIEIKNLIRALNPRPVARTYFRNKHVQIFRVSVKDYQGKPGEILKIEKDGPVIGAGEGSILIKELKIEGKQKITGKEFCNGYRPKIAEKFG